MTAVAVEGLVKDWGGTRAVDGISLRAEAGQLLALLGPSGCGKSTTLRLIAGLEDISDGRILIGDRDVTHLPPAQRHLSMVFQSYALFPHLSVGQNIVFGLTVRKVPAADRKRRLDRVAEMLGLAHLLDRKPAQLSGGQRQRIALGRAIIAEAPVCLMDEPLSNLDAQLRHQMRVEIRSLQQRLGMTMIYVTHDQTEAMTMADRIVLMRSGRIEQQGTPAQLYQQPNSAFVASFIGAPAMNLLPASVLPGHGGDTRQLGIRPEAIRLVAAEVAAEVANKVANKVDAHVEQIEYLGAESLLGCRIDAAQGAVRLTVRVPGAVSQTPGQRVALQWSTADQCFFEAGDGRRLPDSPTTLTPSSRS